MRSILYLHSTMNLKDVISQKNNSMNIKWPAIYNSDTPILSMERIICGSEKKANKEVRAQEVRQDPMFINRHKIKPKDPITDS